MILNIDHLNLTVASFKESVKWYKNVFGFELVEEGVQNNLPWGIIKAGEAMLCIYEAPDRLFMSGSELQNKNFHGLSHFSLRVEDEERFLKKVEDNKLELGYGGLIQWPHSKAWYVTDPTGYEIEVCLWNNNQIKFD